MGSTEVVHHLLGRGLCFAPREFKTISIDSNSKDSMVQLRAGGDDELKVGRTRREVYEARAGYAIGVNTVNPVTGGAETD